jgi:hypothetical protein
VREIPKELQTILAIFGVLAVVVAFQLLYPRRPEFYLYRLSKSFGIDERAPDYPLKNQWLFVRSALEKGRLDAFLPWQYVHFDVCIDNTGVWMLFNGPEPEKCAPSLLVPWRQIRFVKHMPNRSYFTFLAEEPVGISVSRELGEKLTRYIPPWEQ